VAFGKFRKAKEGPTELNLIPVMNLFVVLIPFLLAGAAFFKVGVIPTSLPAHDPNQSDVPQTPVTVACNLLLSRERVALTISSTSFGPDELDEMSREWTVKKDDPYPADEVQAYLEELKEKYPKSSTITIQPDGDIPYQRLVGILDKIREKKTDKVDKEGREVYKELFPVTIFSRLIKNTDPPEGGEGGDDFDFEEGGE
jgi:biopolymer transport protein ExbD